MSSKKYFHLGNNRRETPLSLPTFIRNPRSERLQDVHLIYHTTKLNNETQRRVTMKTVSKPPQRNLLERHKTVVKHWYTNG